MRPGKLLAAYVVGLVFTLAALLVYRHVAATYVLPLEHPPLILKAPELQVQCT